MIPLVCALCPETEDLEVCIDCGAVLCFDHRRDFPSENMPTEIYCIPCLERSGVKHV
jgi:hypothetical protein